MKFGLSYIKNRLSYLWRSAVVIFVNAGTFTGEMWVEIESCNIKNKKTIMFLSLPKMVIRSAQSTAIVSGLNQGILDKAKKLPFDVYYICLKEYQMLKKSSNHLY